MEVNLPVKNKETHRGIREVSGEGTRSVRELALYALKEVKDAEDLPLVSKLMHDPVPAVRRAALQALLEVRGDKVEGSVLQESLSDENAGVVIEALRGIRRWKIKEAEKAIILLLDHKNSSVREGAIRTLGVLGSEAAVSKFRERFESVSVWEKAAMVSALGSIDNQEAIQIVIPLLDASHPYLRGTAVEALEATAYQITEGKLKKLLVDEHYFVIKKTLEYIEERKEERLLPEVAALLSHADVSVDVSACQVLGELKNPQSVSPLIKFMEDNQDRLFLQKKAVEALVRIGGEEAEDYLMRCLSRTNPKLRQLAARALGELKSSEATLFLIKVLEDPDDEVRIAAFQSLAQIKDFKATPTLIEIVGREDLEIEKRKKAIQTLGEIGDSRAVDPLVGILQGAEEKLKSTTAEALGRIGDKRVLQPLMSILSEYTLPPEVREKAIWALWQLEAKEAVPSIMNLITEKVIKMQMPETESRLVFDSESVRIMGLQALADLGSEELVPTIVKAINTNPSSRKLEKVAAETLTRLAGEVYLVRPYVFYPEFFLESMDPPAPLPASCEQEQGVFQEKDLAE